MNDIVLIKITYLKNQLNLYNSDSNFKYFDIYLIKLVINKSTLLNSSCMTCISKHILDTNNAISNKQPNHKK